MTRGIEDDAPTAPAESKTDGACDSEEHKVGDPFDSQDCEGQQMGQGSVMPVSLAAETTQSVMPVSLAAETTPAVGPNGSNNSEPVASESAPEAGAVEALLEMMNGQS